MSRDDTGYMDFVMHLPLQTTLRLELLSAVFLSCLVVNVTINLSALLSLEKPRCFTDSQVALFWIKGVEREWKSFCLTLSGGNLQVCFCELLESFRW